MSRDADGKWQKGGKSPNPGGRPKQLAAVQALARRYTVQAIKVLVTIMNDEKAKKGERRRAAADLLNRGWGMPTQPVNLDGTASGSITVVIRKGLGDEETPQSE